MDIITTQSRGTDFVEVDRDIVLEDTPRTRIVFKAAMHSGGIRGEIIRYRKDANGACSDIVPVNFNSLHANDSIKMNCQLMLQKNFMIHSESWKQYLRSVVYNMDLMISL